MQTDIHALASSIDNELLELTYQRAHLESLLEVATKAAERTNTTVMEQNRRQTQVATLTYRIKGLQEKITVLESVHSMYDWNRAWIVPGGHVHKDIHCHPLFFDTTRILCPEVSAMTEEEIVAKAGERACTVCYPSAPSEYLKLKSELFTRDEVEEAAKRRAKEAARTAKEAAKMTVFLPGEGKNGRHETFGTVRSARNEALRAMDWYFYCTTFYKDNGGAAKYYINFTALIEAIAEREGVEVSTIKNELTDKAIKKFRKEHKDTELVL